MKTPIFTGSTNTKLPRNTFDLTHERKLSGRMGKLIPAFLMDVVPGDKISLKMNAFIRFAPMVAPPMHQINVYMHCFFVPNRILWSNWEKFITGGPDGRDTSVHPTITLDLKSLGTGNLPDYLGLPVGESVDQNAPAQTINAFPFAVYNKIYEDYYRDQNLIAEDEDSWTLQDGNNSIGAGGIRTGLKTRSWNHDYYTSSLPFAQRGPEALLPLGQTAPIYAYDEDNPPPQGYPLNQPVRSSGDGSILGVSGADLQTGNFVPSSVDIAPNNNQPEDAVYIDINNTNYADLAGATAASITDLRRAFKLQEWLEKNARGGARYTEWLQVHFGVRSSDARLQRAEYLGGFSSPVKISEVLQTSGTGNTEQPEPYSQTPQGNMAGHGVSIGSGKYVSKYCEEHGYIMGIMSVMPKTAYQQGIPKHFLREDKFEYYTPEFAHIGEQPIEEREIYVPAVNDGKGTWGYTPRYAEYKFMSNTVHGQFRDSLDFWHLGRKFSSPPLLNQEFIECNVDDIEERIFAVPKDTEGNFIDNLWCHVINEVKASRQMPIYGEPKF